MKNNNLYEKTINLIEHGKIKQALMLTRKLLKNNPDSIILKMQYAKLLTYNEKTKLRGIDMMMKIYHSNLKNSSLIELAKQAELCDDFTMARYFFEEAVKAEKISSIYAVLGLIELDMIENKFEEAYQLLTENYIRLTNIIGKNVISNINFHIRYKLGLVKKEEDVTTYYKRNLINYNEDDIIIHIKKHTDSSDIKKVHTQFEKNVDIIELFNKVKQIISISKPSYSTSVDFYHINYGNIIGNTNGEETTYLEVVTYINTKNILTIYPISKEVVINKQKVKKYNDFS